MTRHTHLLMLLASASFALAGCPEEPTPTPGDDMAPAVDMSPDTTPEEDTTPDMPPTEDMAEDMPPVGPSVDVLEGAEPNDQVNPDEGTDTSTPFMAGQSFGGFIGAGAGEDVDVDYFRVPLEAGQVLNLSIESTGAGVGTDGIVVEFFDLDDNVVRILEQSAGTSRQIFIPFSGTYYVVVYDARSLAEMPPQHGGPDATYAIQTSTTTVEAMMASIGDSVNADLNDGNIDAYSLSPEAETVLTAEVFAGRAPVESELDPVLFVWDGTQVVALSDDIDVDAENYDSFLTLPVTFELTYTLILDSFTNTTNGAYQLDLNDVDDAPDAPNDLMMTATGQIDAPKSGRFDSDYYAFDIMPGQSVQVRAQPVVNSQFVPALIVGFEDDSGINVIGTAKAVETSAALTITHPGGAMGPGRYIVGVDHAPNLEEGATLVGGADYGFEITRTDVDPFMELSIAGATDALDLGSYLTYRLTPESDRDLLFLTAETAFPEAELVFSQFDAMDGFSQVGTSVAFLAPNTDPISLALREAEWQGAIGATMFDVTVGFESADLTAITYTDVAEAADNTAPATAQALTAPARVTGVTAAEGDMPMFDHYKVTLAQGERLVLVTEEDPAAPLRDAMMPELGREGADTIVTVLNAAGDELATNDDYQTGGDLDGYSALIFTAPAAGDYTIVVSPFRLFDFANGPYRLLVSTYTAE